MGIEERIIKLIESLDRIMETWDKLTLRRSIVNIFSILIFVQIIIFIIILIFGRDIHTNVLGVMGLEFTAWGTMIAFYFNNRGKEDERDFQKSVDEAVEGEEEQEHEE